MVEMNLAPSKTFGAPKILKFDSYNQSFEPKILKIDNYNPNF